MIHVESWFPAEHNTQNTALRPRAPTIVSEPSCHTALGFVQIPSSRGDIGVFHEPLPYRWRYCTKHSNCYGDSWGLGRLLYVVVRCCTTINTASKFQFWTSLAPKGTRGKSCFCDLHINPGCLREGEPAFASQEALTLAGRDAATQPTANARCRPLVSSFRTNVTGRR